MPRELPTENSDGREYIQYRGPQTSVTHDATSIRFDTEHRGDMVAHRPLPVVDADVDPSDAPEDAVARPVAEQVVESNPLICWGVACEVCGDVFDTPKGESSHRSVHADDGDDSGGD